MPLGVQQWGRAFANRTRRGLYAGRQVLFGNRVSEDGGNRTRRKWLPNVQNKRLWSELLERMVPLRVTTGAMRNIDKAGGLDAYVRKIAGTREDSDKAAQVREMLAERQQQLERQATRSALLATRRAQQAAREARLGLMPQAARMAVEQELDQLQEPPRL